MKIVVANSTINLPTPEQLPDIKLPISFGLGGGFSKPMLATVDTGAMGLVISSDVFEKLGLEKISKDVGTADLKGFDETISTSRKYLVNILIKQIPSGRPIAIHGILAAVTDEMQGQIIIGQTALVLFRTLIADNKILFLEFNQKTRP